MALPDSQQADTLIGIDLGTSGVRACVINTAGDKLAEAKATLPTSVSKNPGHYQQNPDDWWKACLQVLDRLFRMGQWQVTAIAVDGTSGTLLLCDEANQPVTPALMYNDVSGRHYLDLVSSVAPADSAVLSASSALLKLLQLCEQLPSNARYAAHQADWIATKLGASLGCSDENNTLKLGYDPVKRCWPDWLNKLPFPQHLLPTVHPVGSQTGWLEPELCTRWQQQNPVAIIAGTTDSNAAALASGIRLPGEGSTALGSTLAMKMVSDQPIFSAAYGIYSHRLGDFWLLGGASNTGGQVLKQFFTPQQLEQLSGRIDTSQPSPLDYYPLPKTGERFPVNDPDKPPRLEPRPNNDSAFLYGLLQGIAHIEQQGYAKLTALGAPRLTRVISTGGGATNKTWQTIRHRCLSVPVEQARFTEAAYGSALIAAGALQSS